MEDLIPGGVGLPDPDDGVEGDAVLGVDGESEDLRAALLVAPAQASPPLKSSGRRSLSPPAANRS
jgi:hypothetical protein